MSHSPSQQSVVSVEEGYSSGEEDEPSVSLSSGSLAESRSDGDLSREPSQRSSDSHASEAVPPKKIKVKIVPVL